jgi:carboxyl-terminal processing protease
MTSRLIALAAVLLALAAGLYLGGHPGDLPRPIRDAFVSERSAVLTDAENVIQDNYTHKVSKQRLENGSLQGMVKSLDDRFSSYFTPRQRTLFEQSIGGEFSGVGMTVVEHRRGLLVTSVFKRSPAARAAVRPGDLITGVNGKSIAGESSDVATARIKGKPGTPVTLTVVPHGARKKPRVIRLRRATIKVPVVQGRLRNVQGTPIGVVRIASFSDGVHGDVLTKVRSLLRRGAKGFVIDLRGNGGGLLDEAVLVSSVFIPDGVIVVTKGRKRPKRVLRAAGGSVKRKPIVVLVDRNTASASEIVTAALEERLGSTVVGRRTFGKGVFGELFSLRNGGAIDLTLGSYFTPKGHNLAGKGITPSVKAQDDLKTRQDEALDRALGVLGEKIARHPQG